MGFSEAVQWWEEWQLRVLVLSSLFLQYFLNFAAPQCKRCIPSWFRFIIWLAYLGSDAVAIYALAALFNRHKNQEWVSSHHDDASLEALWAPILLVHLGGVDTITAYNIEDNELWRRHVLTSVSQVAVAIYVFHKSFSGDNKLFRAAILIFVAGILKCFEKPIALKSASISSLISIKSSSSSDRSMPADNMSHQLPVYEDDFRGDEMYYPFVDMAPSIVNHSGKKHEDLKLALCLSFDRLYTKTQVSSATFLMSRISRITRSSIWGYLLQLVLISMMFAALGLFHGSHKKLYNSIDVKVTYTLLSCTAILEYIGPIVFSLFRMVPGTSLRKPKPIWPDQIAQYNLIGHLARSKKHWILTSVVAFLRCMDYLDPVWCMKPCKSSRDITDLVRGYIRTWKNDHRSEAATNRAFNDSRGQWSLTKQGCCGSKILRESMCMPFDRSVLLWHLATDFCYVDRVDNTSGETARQNSRVISNYMAYLLFINPEMLITGARPILIRYKYEKLKSMQLEDGEEKTAFQEDGEPMQEKQALHEELAKKIIQKLKGGDKARGVTDDAWELSKELMHMCKGDNVKMWEVIEGVWVEILCFSASRCRGYLHAKSLGKGGEYLSYIWLLQLHMGIETLAEKMQRTSELPEQGNSNASGGGADIATSAMLAKTSIDDENEQAELHEEESSHDGPASTTPATTVIGDEKRDEDGGSRRATSAALATSVVGDENV